VTLYTFCDNKYFCNVFVYLKKSTSNVIFLHVKMIDMKLKIEHIEDGSLTLITNNKDILVAQIYLEI